ncbi:TetR/AcrR family transcriptional regulator [Streptomyces sp. NPDC057694]|uniref:TetR/AcrR family transcriptional regulator n=1 Tax=Streptomyces sp. NPDC057694 TaxID=3346216 RepID=UPI0036B1243B
MATPRRRAPRSDGEENRARIIEAARHAFTADPGASLQSISKAVGIGQGTMYRHFANREELLVTVYREDVEALIDAAPRLLDEHEPVEALRRWLGQLATYGRIKHGASRAVEAATRADLGSHYYPPFIDALGRLLTAGQETGGLRRDADADEVLLLVSFLWKADGGADWQSRAEHALGIVLDGLRAPAPL